MPRFALWSAALLTLGLLGCAAQGASPDAVRTEVQQLVRSYADVNNKADVTALMDMISQDAGTSSISDGSITRGWEAIRTANDAVVGKIAGYKMTLGSIDVVPLGGTYAIATAPVTIASGTDQAASEESGAMTWVVEKSAKG